MGSVAWPEHRDDVPKGEPDTAFEKKLYMQLRNYLSGKGSIDDDMVEDLTTMLQQGLYPKILHAPDAKTVYRGMGVDATWLKKALKTQKLKNAGRLDTGFTFSPRGGHISSWTYSIGTAEMFAHESAHSSIEYSVVLGATVDQNVGHLLSCPGGLYNVKGFDAYADEGEVIGLYDIKVSSITWGPP